MPRPVALFALALSAGTASASDAEFFEKKVRPLLLTHCVGCHGPEKQKGGLRLDGRAAALKGGDTGPAAVPGDAGKSLLVAAVRYADDLKMPPKGKLAAHEIETLAAWVAGGMPWPGPDGGPQAAEAFDVHARAKAHWSFQPVRRPAAPEGRNPIDGFIREKLAAAGLTPSPPADRRTLIRRVTFDLTGLPPTPEEVDAFLADASPQAFEKVVDRLLACPHYGERWGRHWLDLARYAETHGHEFDFEIPDAWRYRDWVIRAFNADLPYDRFLTEQIAGDLLPDPRRRPDGSNESVVGTGFWFLYEAKHSPVDARADWADRIDNQIDVFGKAVLGLTISCARCHDHKFDPVSTKDYYALFGTLASTRQQRAALETPAAATVLADLKAARAELAALLAHPEPPPPPDGPLNDGWRSTATPLERFDAGWRSRWDAAGLGLRPEAGSEPHSGRESAKLTAALRSPTFTLDKPFVAVRAAGRNAQVRLVMNGLQLIRSPIYGGLAKPVNGGESPAWIVFDVKMWKGQPAYLEFLDDGPGYFAVREAWLADTPPPAEKGVPQPAPPAAELPADLADNAAAKKLAARIKELEARLPDPGRATAARDGTGRNERVFIRGNHKTPGDEVPRRFLEALNATPFPGTGSGRLALAAAVTDPANPLTARVMVNRVWKHHFGEGLVRSPDDFGRQGQPPTHPELLDWLASEFVAPSRPTGGRPWELKRLHRLILLSDTYQQASRATPETAAKATAADPLNKLLHRQNVRRLEAEAIRDAMLLVSGRLDRTAEGPGVMPYLTEHSVGRGRPGGSGPVDGNGRRSVYQQVRRNFLNPMFVAFDYPTPFTAIGRRSVSNVPAQALALLNNRFVLGQADLWGVKAAAAPPGERVDRMYAAAFGRPPTAAERAAAAAFVAAVAAEHGSPDSPKAWAGLAHVLFNAKEFVFVE